MCIICTRFSFASFKHTRLYSIKACRYERASRSGDGLVIISVVLTSGIVVMNASSWNGLEIEVWNWNSSVSNRLQAVTRVYVYNTSSFLFDASERKCNVERNVGCAMIGIETDFRCFITAWKTDVHRIRRVTNYIVRANHRSSTLWARFAFLNFVDWNVN